MAYSLIYNLGKFSKSRIAPLVGCIMTGNGQIREIFIGTKNCSRDELMEKRTNCFSQFKPLSETRFKPVSHVVMDLDGIFLDTPKYYYDAHIRYLERYKKRYTPELKVNTFGIHEIDAAKYLIRELDLPLAPEVYVHGIWQDLRGSLQKAKLIEGVKELVCHLSENRVPLALITSYNSKSFDIKTKKYKGLLKHFCHIVKGDDPELKHGKPEPDIYKLAASRFLTRPTEPSKVLVLEASLLGVKSASAAKMQIVAMPDNSYPRDKIKGADLIISNLYDMDLSDFGFPKL